MTRAFVVFFFAVMIAGMLGAEPAWAQVDIKPQVEALFGRNGGASCLNRYELGFSASLVYCFSQFDTFLGMIVSEVASKMQPITLAAVLLAVMIFALKLTAGALQSVRAEGAMLIFKIAFVLILSGILSTPGGAGVLNPTKLIFSLPFELVEMLQIDNLMTVTTQGSYQAMECPEPSVIFGRDTEKFIIPYAHLDCMFGYFFGVSWTKMAAGSLWGILAAFVISGPFGIAVVFMCIMMFFAFFRMLFACMFYTVSALWLLFILMTLMPIVLPAMLFQYTYKFFKNWYGQILGAVFQPLIVVVVTVISVAVVSNILVNGVGNHPSLSYSMGWTDPVDLAAARGMIAANRAEIQTQMDYYDVQIPLETDSARKTEMIQDYNRLKDMLAATGTVSTRDIINKNRVENQPIFSSVRDNISYAEGQRRTRHRNNGAGGPPIGNDPELFTAQSIDRHTAAVDSSKFGMPKYMGYRVHSNSDAVARQYTDTCYFYQWSPGANEGKFNQYGIPLDSSGQVLDESSPYPGPDIEAGEEPSQTEMPPVMHYEQIKMGCAAAEDKDYWADKMKNRLRGLADVRRTTRKLFDIFLSISAGWVALYIFSHIFKYVPEMARKITGITAMALGAGMHGAAGTGNDPSDPTPLQGKAGNALQSFATATSGRYRQMSRQDKQDGTRASFARRMTKLGAATKYGGQQAIRTVNPLNRAFSDVNTLGVNKTGGKKTKKPAPKKDKGSS